ncbi:MAG: tRNA (adenosine(37)-N6)-dimethylallyltransferase MiaA [Elusimicrobia bacterium]|nr:tRNA (adenosine(37)-N6)-dimethylallyltransferase MiaA [Elusimicrobiota bacterium]
MALSRPGTILALVGPTASGKTEVALELARQENAEILSCDSRQIYKYLAAGTCKPIGEWRRVPAGKVYLVQDIPYHLLDFLDPKATFNAVEYARKARKTLQEIRARGKNVILVGGTGLYLKAFLEGLHPVPPSQDGLRKALQIRLLREGSEALHQELRRLDPEAAQKIPSGNAQRILRALEVHQLSGRPISSFWKKPKKTTVLPAITVCMLWEKEVLKERILARSKQILPAMIGETRQLLSQGYRPADPALQSLGYRHAVRYLEGGASFSQALEALLQDTRAYAKRQRTWFLHQTSGHLLNLRRQDFLSNCGSPIAPLVDNLRTLWKRSS